MKRVVLVCFLAVALVSISAPLAEGVTCNPSELSPCLQAFTSPAAPTPACCDKLRQQRPCFCGYLRNPTYGRYLNSPNARKISNGCNVPFPRCP